MPYSKQHFNEKSRMAKKNSRKGLPCPFTICRFQSIHSENVVKRHLETFGRYESELESGSNDEGNIDHQLQEDIGENLHDTSSSETDEGKRKRRRTQQSFSNSVIAERNDPGCEVMQVLDTSTGTDSTRYDRNLVMGTNETTDTALNQKTVARLCMKKRAIYHHLGEVITMISLLMNLQVH